MVVGVPAEFNPFHNGHAALAAKLRAKGADILAAIRKDREIKKETDEKLQAFLRDFAKSFA